MHRTVVFNGLIKNDWDLGICYYMGGFLELYVISGLRKQ